MSTIKKTRKTRTSSFEEISLEELNELLGTKNQVKIPVNRKWLANVKSILG